MYSKICLLLTKLTSSSLQFDIFKSESLEPLFSFVVDTVTRINELKFNLNEIFYISELKIQSTVSRHT